MQLNAITSDSIVSGVLLDITFPGKCISIINSRDSSSDTVQGPILLLNASWNYWYLGAHLSNYWHVLCLHNIFTDFSTWYLFLSYIHWKFFCSCGIDSLIRYGSPKTFGLCSHLSGCLNQFFLQLYVSFLDRKHWMLRLGHLSVSTEFAMLEWVLCWLNGFVI